jgi:RNA polymerase sigma-54 factor
MRLEQTPRPDQTVKVSTRLITSSNILHLSADELEQTVNQEQTENPALEVTETHVCLFCGAPIYTQVCTACGHFSHQTQPIPASTEVSHQDALLLPDDYDPQEYTQQAFYDIDNAADIENDESDDPMTRIPTSESLTEILLQQLETIVSPDDATIAEQLVGNLNERGYLEVTPEEIASYLQVSPERVEYVLGQLQTLEPLGIGARNPKECLLIQLQTLSETDSPPPLTYTLIDTHLKNLGHNQLHEIARQLKVSEQEVCEAYHYIRTRLHPYPAYLYRGDTHSLLPANNATYIHPDVIIRPKDTGFEIEIIEQKRYKFQVARQDHNSATSVEINSNNTDLQHYIYSQKDRARFFVECIHRRWQTLHRVIEIIVKHQRAFLEKGIRYLQPLTRAEVASQLHLDEGTVSRTTANKYVLLPNGRLMPLSDFFDGSLSIKDMLHELIQKEDPQHRLSDEELARLLSTQGVQLARRTVTKYREEMGIGSSRDRNLHYAHFGNSTNSIF